MTQYVLGSGVAQDLETIWDYIARDNVDAADRWIEKLSRAFEASAEAPGMGHKRKDLTSLPVLFWPLDSYLVVYRVQSGSTEIIAVTQGARDLPEFLARRTQ